MLVLFLWCALVSVETKAQAAGADKMKHRLEQLDDLDEGAVKETLNLSQKEYVKKIDDMHQTLVSAWEVDQRVKALKIAIQVCSQLLGGCGMEAGVEAGDGGRDEVFGLRNVVC